jgi:hypothetical protein
MTIVRFDNIRFEQAKVFHALGRPATVRASMHDLRIIYIYIYLIRNIHIMV